MFTCSTIIHFIFFAFFRSIACTTFSFADFAIEIGNVFADFIAHTHFLPLAFNALIMAFEFTFFKTRIAVFQFATSTTLIFFSLFHIPCFAVANVCHAIFAVSNFLDAVRFAKAITAAAHSRLAFVRFDIQARNFRPVVVFALVIAAGNAIDSGSSVLIHAIPLSGHAIVIRDVLAGRHCT